MCNCFKEKEKLRKEITEILKLYRLATDKLQKIKNNL